MTGLEIAMIANAIIGGAGALFGGSDQERTGFTGDNAPEAVLGKARGALDNVFGGALNRAGSPIELPGFNPQMPTFAGGGLPMPFGVLGRGEGSEGQNVTPGAKLRLPGQGPGTAGTKGLRGERMRQRIPGSGEQADRFTRADPNEPESRRVPGLGDSQSGSAGNNSPYLNSTPMSWDDIMAALGGASTPRKGGG